MTLQSLINHSAQLANIIEKSREPGDKLASEYFRSHKYIGSHDRRFISESVFATLRMLSLASYCGMNACRHVFKEHDLIGMTPAGIAKINVIASCAVSSMLPPENKPFDPEALCSWQNLQNEQGFMNKLSDAVADIFSISINLSMELTDQIIKAYLQLDSDFSLELSKFIDSPASNENMLELLPKRLCLPSLIVRQLAGPEFTSDGIDKAVGIGLSMMHSAPFTIRVNSHLIDREKVLRKLNDEGIDARPTSISPDGIIINQRVKLDGHEIYRKGLIEIQDEGSQLISYALAPRQSMQILDACAGAGGKSLHLASITRDKAAIYSFDVISYKLKELKNRADRCGLKSIIPLGKDDVFRKNYDAVLVDAPCSGTGTARRMPMQKWRINEEMLKKYSDKQIKILHDYSQAVKPGGILVYATCSLLSAENEGIVEDFLDRNREFEPDPLSPVFSTANISISGLGADDYYVTMRPDIHRCDGFFMARLKRTV